MTDIAAMYPIYNDIIDAVQRLNFLLEEADRSGLSIRFSQGNKPSKSHLGGLAEPKLNILTISYPIIKNQVNESKD